MRPAWVVSSSSEVPSANSVMTDSSWSTASASLHSDPTQQSHLPYIKYGYMRAGDVSSPGSFCISSSPNHHWAPQKLSEAAALKTYFPMTYFPPTITIPHFTPSHFTQPSSLTPTLPLDYDRSRVNDLQQRQRIKSVCLICGDRASGKHYGVFSCEGCKGFFKRTIRKELSYSCRHAGVCVIDKRQRNRCQACRFTKCQSMGMRREAVQEERISDRSYAQSDFSHTNSLPSLPSASPPICLNLSSPSSALSNCLPSSSNTATVSNTQTNSDPPHVGIKTEHSQQPGILRSLDEMATKESIGEDSTKAHTRHLCRWALSSPEFRLLGREHQAALLIHGWQDLILAEATYRTQPNSLRAEPNSSMLPAAFEVELETSPVITKLFSAINEMLVEKWHADSVRPDEIEALRFILLFNQDASSPGNPLPACVAASRQQQVTLLSKLSLSATLANPHPCPSRLARLLLRLPSLRTLAAQCMETLVIFPRRPMETDVIRILNGVASKYGNRPRELFSLL